jgi:hypothetical protein
MPSYSVPRPFQGDQGFRRKVPATLDAYGLSDRIGFGLCREPVKPQASFVVAILRNPAEREALLHETPPSR